MTSKHKTSRVSSTPVYFCAVVLWRLAHVLRHRSCYFEVDSLLTLDLCAGWWIVLPWMHSLLSWTNLILPDLKDGEAQSHCCRPAYFL